MIKCIAIDDEPLALQQMAAYISKTPFLELTGQCESALHAIEILHDSPVDLLFVDINMPDLNGMDFVKSLGEGPKIIFTTAYGEYALEGFKVNAIDYLLKPISYPDFLRAANKAREWFSLHRKGEQKSGTEEGFLFVKSEYKLVRINLNDIKYVEGMSEYVRIHLVEGKPVMTLMTMKKIMDQLPPSRFMRVHRSYIVNLEKITTIERLRIIFDDKIYIPVSNQYKDQFQKYIDDNFV